MTSGKRIVVVGACNQDLIAYTERLPVIGETLHGKAFGMGHGGKGANQAVMAAKLDGAVSMISKVGDDVFGRETIANFKKFGVDTTHVLVTDQASTGVAPITVDADGRNSIIIVSGANDLLTVEEIEAARDIIKDAHIVVAQLELPVHLTLAALKIAKSEGVLTFLNTAPAVSELPAELYDNVDILCANEVETQMLTGLPVDNKEQTIDAAKALLDRVHGKQVLLTLGERGSVYVTPDDVDYVPASKVDAVDSTGAGDSYVGALAYFLANGASMKDAMVKAGAIATISVQAKGTQLSYPLRKDLPADLFSA